jgi:hypothetical protein
MTTLDGYTVAAHLYQYAPYESARTRSSGCTWMSGAQAANNVGHTYTGDGVLSKVLRREETTPASPGWSLADLDLAMSRLRVPFAIGTGGWAGLRAARAKGYGIVLQGDSDQFSNATCSGKFDGDHAIYVHPANAGTAWRIDDPICPAGRWEEEATLHRYAADFRPTISYGILPVAVPRVPVGYTVRIEAGAMVRVYNLSSKAGVDCIKDWWEQRWGDKASSAVASAPVHRDTCKGASSATTTKVLSGTFKGRHIRVGDGVTLEEA